MDDSSSIASQSDSLNVSTSHLTISSTLSSLQINGVKYELAEHLPNKRGKTSWIWKEGFQLVDSLDSLKLKRFWMCRQYYDEGKNVLYAMTTTAHANKHLNEVHQLFDPSLASKDTLVLGPASSSWDPIRFKELLIHWIVTMHISFSQVEYEAFQSLLLYLNSQLASHLSTSGNTIRNWIMEDFKQRQHQIKKELHLSKSLIHFSFDMWTSPNSMVMIAIVAHYVSYTGEAKDCLLGLKRVLGSHSGENMARSVTTVIEDYELKNQIGK